MENIILKDNQPQKQTVFDSQEGCVFRIPALCYNSSSKTLFAFAEKRKTLSDNDAEMLVMKTAKLNEDDPNEIQWPADFKEVKNAHSDGYRTMNPCPVFDKRSEKLFLFFICVKNCYSEQWQIRLCCNKALLCYITTADDGETWSALTDLTSRLPEICDWATFAVGPGHGLQTQSGRLIVPVYAYPKKLGCCCFPKCSAPTSYALALCYENPDKGWQFGNMLQTESGECQMAEILDDKGNWVVYCNARSKSGHRVEAVSVDEGVNFSILTGSKELKKLVDTNTTGCQGSVVSFPAQSEVGGTKGEHNSNNTWLLFSHTADVDKRVDLGVYLNKSPLDPDKWSKPWIINGGTSGYSDLAYIGNNRFVCLMECGKEKQMEGRIEGAKYQISSVILSYSQV